MEKPNGECKIRKIKDFGPNELLPAIYNIYNRGLKYNSVCFSSFLFETNGLVGDACFKD